MSFFQLSLTSLHFTLLYKKKSKKIKKKSSAFHLDLDPKITKLLFHRAMLFLYSSINIILNTKPCIYPSVMVHFVIKKLHYS